MLEKINKNDLTISTVENKTFGCEWVAISEIKFIYTKVLCKKNIYIY